MNVTDLQDLFRKNNSHEDELFEKAGDIFIQKVREELDKIYIEGKWLQFFGCNVLGICIERISYFKDFEIYFGYILKEESLKDDYDCIPFDEYFSNVNYEEKSLECCGFQDDNIIPNLKPFVDVLEKKGFKVYVNEDNKNLVIEMIIDPKMELLKK